MTETQEGISQEMQTEISAQVDALVSGARITKIETPQQMANANELANQVKKLGRDLETQRKLLVARLNSILSNINTFFKQEGGPFEKLKGLLKNVDSKISEFEAEQRRIAVERQRLADEEARKERMKKEEAERKARARAEAERAEAVAKLKAAQESKDAEEKARLEKEAAKAEEKAAKQDAKANAAGDAAAAVVADSVAPVIPKTKGRSVRHNWQVEVEQEKIFINWAIKTENFHLIQANQKTLSKAVKAGEGTFRPRGCRVWNDPTTVRRV